MKIFRSYAFALVFITAAAAIALTGCSGGGGGGAAGDTAGGKNSILYSVLNSAPASNCPSGGITVYAGIDTNGNGVLDTSEIASTQYVCNGLNGTNGTNGTNGNTWPIANAGPDQKAAADGDMISLDGSGSSDPNGSLLTYSWTITARPVGSLASLASPLVSNPTFTPDKAGKYELSLVVSDGQSYSLPDTVIVRAGMPLPDTGQTRWYSSVFGDDGDYSINPPSYSDNGDGTILDNVTGLTWQKCSMGLSGPDCASGTASTYNWYQASGTYDAAYNSNTTNVCDSLNLPGTGWRLPTRMELLTIANYGVCLPAINDAYFPNTQSSVYWSSTTYAPNTANAWYVDFYCGPAGNLNKSTNTYHVRCVRGQ